MQNIAIFDIVIISITLLLGLKGLLRGFIKEVFGLLAIVGGIFIASRIAPDVGQLVAPILGLESSATIKLIGFIASLIGVWAAIYFIGVIISKIFSVSGLGLFDRILGFLFGSAKVFFILSIIVYALYQVQSFKNLMDKKMSDAMVFPLLVETGGFIIKLDSKDFIGTTPKEDETEKVDVEDPDVVKDSSLVEDFKKTMKEVKDTTVESGNAMVDSVKKSIGENIDKASEKIKEEANEAIEQSTTPKSEETQNTEKGN